jgi:hypothetical protein
VETIREIKRTSPSAGMNQPNCFGVSAEVGRHAKSPAVEKAKVEAFIKDRHEWRKRRTNQQDKTSTSK